MNQHENDTFVDFKGACIKWIERFGLTDWRIEIVARDLDETSVKARTDYNFTQRTACVSWNTRFFHDNPEAIAHPSDSETALHEILHIVLRELVEIAIATPNDSHTVAAAEHGAINRLIPRLL